MDEILVHYPRQDQPWGGRGKWGGLRYNTGASHGAAMGLLAQPRKETVVNTPQDPREFFGQHHRAYVTSEAHARGQDLAALIDGLEPRPAEPGLDVATGSGHTAILLARRGLQVTAVDVTPEMLDDAQALALEQGVMLSTVEAPAERLPFADGQFAVVTCRRAAHHFTDITGFLREGYRVLAPGGRLGISDMTGSPVTVDWLNRLERLRDPSHNRALSPAAWREALTASGFSAVRIELWEEPMSFVQWLRPIDSEGPSGRAALNFMTSQDAPEEFVRGEQFIKRRVLIWARR